MPGLLVAIVAPMMKAEPVRVTATVEPAMPLAGLTELSVGAGALTVKEAEPVVPPDVVTVTLAAPSAAAGETTNEAVI